MRPSADAMRGVAAIPYNARGALMPCQAYGNPQNSLRSFRGTPTAAWIKKSESKCFRIFLKKDSETRASPTINFLWRFYKRRLA